LIDEEYTNKVGYSERTDVVIEPRLSLQWFMKMEDISRKALEVVEDELHLIYVYDKSILSNITEKELDDLLLQQLTDQ